MTSPRTLLIAPNIATAQVVQVDEADLERAKGLLAELDSRGELEGFDNPDEALSAEADRKALRAWRFAVLGLGMWPFFHPWALVLGLRALKEPGLSAEGRGRAWTAVRTSVAALLALVALIAGILLGLT
jgi:hypothetical protein